MKKTFLLLFIAVLFAGCNNNKNVPDVSEIKIELETKRFDRDFFSLDTLGIQEGLSSLQAKYPDFLSIFLQNIIGVNDDEGVKAFYRSYKQVFDSAQKIYADFGAIEKQFEKAFQYVKFYFPDYKTPASIIPVLGPMNSKEDLARMGNGDYTPDFLGPDFLGISLQFYLGKDFSLYNTDYFINNVAPLYRSRRFAREYIIADAMKLIIDDLFPDKSSSSPLIEQMVEKGKHWWLLDKLLPGIPDSIKTGYTKSQLAWCTDNEGLIWSYIVKNEDLRSNNPATIQTYIGESPFTSVFSQEESPGNIGQWIGWQIVKKFAEKNPDMKPAEVMTTPVEKILEEAKYKPK
jgi:hypothetical protein